MRGQIFEILGLTVLILAILAILVVVYGNYIGREQTETLKMLGERQEIEGFKAGINSILYTTENNTGKTILELLGIAAYNGDYKIDYGVGAGKVDLKKELEDRFDYIYGKGHWYLRLPFPNITSNIQIVVVSDTSGSMCNQIRILVTDVPKIIDKLRKKGKKAEMTLFLLGSPACCVHENGNLVPFHIEDYVNETKYFHVVTMPDTHPNKGYYCKRGCYRGGGYDEDWGTGLKCAIEMGPYKTNGEYGWNEHAVKIAIPISDELPGGMEPNCPTHGCQRNNFENGLKAALENNVTVFGFSGIACGEFYPLRGGECQREDFERDTSYDYCGCSKGVVKRWMREISNKTGGKMYSLTNASYSAAAIEEIITKAQPKRIPYLEAGTLVPRFKTVRAVTIPIPVSVLGKYSELKVYYWP